MQTGSGQAQKGCEETLTFSWEMQRASGQTWTGYDQTGTCSGEMRTGSEPTVRKLGHVVEKCGQVVSTL